MAEESLSIGWTRAAADGQRKAYRKLLAVNLVLQSLVALAVLLWPASILELVGLPTPEVAQDLARVWATMVLLASAFQLPGQLDPVYNRLPNVIGIIGRGILAILYVFLGGGFLWLALFDGAFGLALFARYRRLVMAELQTRP